MKMLTYNVMSIAFLIFSGWIAYVGGEWGWPAIGAFFLSVVPNTQAVDKSITQENKDSLTQEERSLIDELKKSFKNEDDKK